MKLAKGVVGDDVARLLGATLLGLLQITLEEQGSLAEAQRKHLSILIDEFQVLQGVDWAVLAELRKCGAAFTLATQSLEYLADRDAAILDIVLANIKQYIIFHLSAKDAQTIAAELEVENEDILTLASHMCCIKLVAQGVRQPTFSLTLFRQHWGLAPVLIVSVKVASSVIPLQQQRSMSNCVRHWRHHSCFCRRQK